MKRVVLVHWDAEEAGERAGRLREVGHDVSCHSDFVTCRAMRSGTQRLSAPTDLAVRSQTTYLLGILGRGECHVR
jgi:hypothetical protein